MKIETIEKLELTAKTIFWLFAIGAVFYYAVMYETPQGANQDVKDVKNTTTAK